MGEFSSKTKEEKRVINWNMKKRIYHKNINNINNNNDNNYCDYTYSISSISQITITFIRNYIYFYII